MRTIFLILLLMCGSASAAIKYYDDYPPNTNPPGNFIISIQTKDKSPGGVPYNYMELTWLANWLGVNAFTNGGTIIASNAVITVITNVTFVGGAVTITNVTIVVPGGVTNLNLTPNTVMYADGGSAEASVPNGFGVFTNNNLGGVGWTLALQLTDLGALNFYPTNTFLQLTNSPYLATDGNGQVILGTGLSPTNITLVSGANISFTTNGNGSVTIATSGVITGSLAASNIFNGGLVTPGALDLIRATNNDSLVTNYVQQIGDASTNYTVTSTNTSAAYARGLADASTNYTVTATNTSAGYARSQAGLSTNYTDNATNRAITVQGVSVFLGGSTLAAGSTPAFGGINFTNLGYGLPTNNLGGGAFVFGGPGTAATLYDTNITAATTLKLFDITACGATAGGIKLYVTCSGGTDRILTFPSGCSGAGLGTPPAVTITNAKAAFFDVIYKPGATPVTNVFWSPVY